MFVFVHSWVYALAEWWRWFAYMFSHDQPAFPLCTSYRSAWRLLGGKPFASKYCKHCHMDSYTYLKNLPMTSMQSCRTCTEGKWVSDEQTCRQTTMITERTHKLGLTQVKQSNNNSLVRIVSTTKTGRVALLLRKITTRALFISTCSFGRFAPDCYHMPRAVASHGILSSQLKEHA